MRIRALRARDIGGFSDPVAVEGFSGELDVLVAPNEAGKSTLLAALQAVLFVKHTSRDLRERKSTDPGTPTNWLAQITPTGSAPTIEVDFDTPAGRWRLRKRFLTQAEALLTDLAAGTAIARGEEAGQRALELIGALGERGAIDPGPFGLLWVEQGDSFDLPSMAGSAAVALRHAIEDEIVAAAGGDVLTGVLEAARERLGGLVTPARFQPKTGGELERAVAEQRDAAERLEAANRAVTAIRTSLDRRRELERERNTIDAQAASGEIERRLAETREAAARAEREAAQLRLSEQSVRSGEFAMREHEQRLNRSSDEITELATLEEQRRAGGERSLAMFAAASAARARLAKAEAEAAAASLLVGDLRRRVDALREQQLQHERWVVRQQTMGRIRRANQFAALIATTEAQLGHLVGVTDERMLAARREQREIEVLRARRQSLLASVPNVRIDYVPSPTARIRIGARTIENGERLAVAPALVLDIDGVGTVTVESPVTADVADIDADIDAHRRQLDVLLAAMAVDGLAMAEARHGERIALQRTRSDLAMRISALAPDGVAQLAADPTGVDDSAPPAGEACPELLRATLGELDEAVTEEAHLRAAVLAAATAATQAAADHDRETERDKALLSRLSAIEHRLPPPEQRDAEMRDLEAALQSARTQLDEHVLERRALRDRAKTPEQLRAFTERQVDLVAEIAARDRRLSAIGIELGRIEGALEQEGAIVTAEALGELEQRAASAARRVQRLWREARGARLLVTTLEIELERARNTFVAPVMARLRPLITAVLPNVTAGLDDTLRLATIERGGRVEQPERLSKGTREQLAVLVRLGYARLLADHGRALPVVLDDALVYSDDDRLARMLAVLGQAARHHQVIVLGCRAGDLARLGGNRLEIVPWRQPEARP